MTYSNKLTINVFFLFIMAILFSIVLQYMHSVLGDWVCSGITLNPVTNKLEFFWHFGGTHIETQIHWGYQHWLWFFMGLTIFIIQVIKICTIKNNDGKE